MDASRNSVCEALHSGLEIIAGPSAKIEIRKSPVHGYGVFAKEMIEKDELIEQCRLLALESRVKYNIDTVLRDYVWINKSCQCDECKKYGFRQYIALGLGSLYNHSAQPNTNQQVNFRTETITIKAKQQILPDEEIFISYGKEYWLLRKFWDNITTDMLSKLMENTPIP